MRCAGGPRNNVARARHRRFYGDGSGGFAVPFALSLFILVAAIGAAVDFGRLLLTAATVQTRADSLLRAYLAIPASRRSGELIFSSRAEASINAALAPGTYVVMGVTSTSSWTVLQPYVTVETYFLPLLGIDQLTWVMSAKGVSASRLPRSPPRLVE